MTRLATDHQVAADNAVSAPRRTVLIGATGRVGAALRNVLAEHGDVVTVGRFSAAKHDDFTTLLAEALQGADVVVNVAGVAHLGPEPTAADLNALVEANLLLPVELARACRNAGVPLIHVSSSKAAGSDARSNSYSWSKRAGDATLATSFDSDFRSKGLALIIVRPPALLFGPFDAGKLRHLRWLAKVPESLVPPLRLPALSTSTFLAAIVALIDGVSTHRAGVSTIEFENSDRATLRDIRAAMVQAGQD